MFSKYDTQKVTLRAATIGLGVGLATWLTLLIQGALSVQNIESSKTVAVGFGPFQFNEITKQITGDGSEVSFTFNGGFLWFLVACVVVAGVIGYVLSMRSSTKKSDDDSSKDHTAE